MENSKNLKELVAQAKQDIKAILDDAQVSTGNPEKLHTRLLKVHGQFAAIDIHIDTHCIMPPPPQPGIKAPAK